jgi:ribosomal protein S16
MRFGQSERVLYQLLVKHSRKVGSGKEFDDAGEKNRSSHLKIEK